VPDADDTDPAPLTVVVVHRRRPDLAVQTVDALRAQWSGLRVVIIDNASSPEDRAALRVLDDVEVVELDHNIGFGPAANVGLRRWLADGVGDWCVICPHDAIAEPGCLEHLMATVVVTPRAGMASAEYADEGQYGTAGTRIKPAIHPFLGTFLVPAEVAHGWEDAAHPHGTLMVVRRDCIEEIGLFDERYFAYSEEADLALRARAAGWAVGIVWGAVVRNRGMTSEEGVPEYLMQRNTLMLVRDHFGRGPATALFLVTLWTCAVGSLFPSRRPLYWHAAGRWLALWDFLRGRDGPPNHRLTRGASVQRAANAPCSDDRVPGTTLRISGSDSATSS
jgi:N-acetylglucosaminyl-diphospho-decaprenol L-rhamnosyltransferase